MEALCQNCEKHFPKSELIVDREGRVWCVPCSPEDFKAIRFPFEFTWEEINALRDVLKGDADLDALDIVEGIQEDIDNTILHILKGVLGKDDS